MNGNEENQGLDQANQESPDQEMDQILDDKYARALGWGQIFMQADERVRNNDYDQAKTILEGSDLPSDVKERLLNALQTDDSFIITETFKDYEGRLGTVFSCEECWSGDEVEPQE